MAAQEESNDGWCTVPFSFNVEEASPASVWAILADFGNLGKWATSVLESSVVLEGDPHQAGCVRICRVKAPIHGSGGEQPEVQEKLLEIENSQHRMTYNIKSRNIPIPLGLVSTLQLLPLTSSIDSSDKESDVNDRSTSNGSSDQQHTADKQLELCDDHATNSSSSDRRDRTTGTRILWTVRWPASSDVDKPAFVHSVHSLYTALVADMRNLFLVPRDAPPRTSVDP